MAQTFSQPSSIASPNAPRSARLNSLDVLLLGTLGILWGSAYIFIREGIVFGASPLAFAAVRYGLSAAAFAALAAGRCELVPVRGAVLVSAAVGGTLIIGAYGGLLYWGETGHHRRLRGDPRLDVRRFLPWSLPTRCCPPSG